MEASQLRALQAPLKEKYKSEPNEAGKVLHAEGKLGPELTCEVETEAGKVEAGLHPATGGDGSEACSGDMLLQALVACAGVTLKSVATAMGIDIKEGTVKAEGILDFRGTLGVSREVPVGFKEVALNFDLETEAKQSKINKLIELTERYCVIYQTIKNTTELSTAITAN